ncbi:MAG: DUF3833 family protein [Paracoccaceae bacterium]
MEAVFLGLLGVVIALGAAWARGQYASFLSQTPDNYAAGKAGQFDIRTQFNGPILCEGVIFGLTGKVSSRFEAEFECNWTGNRCVMTETFRYDDGSVQNRAWKLDLGNDGKIKATAEDVVGTGTGTQMGDAVQLKYKLKLPEASGGHVLDVVDWMYLAPNGAIINRSQFRKYGIQVAELVATMRPLDTMEERKAA